MNIWIVTYNDDEGVTSVPFYSEVDAIEAASAWVRRHYENDFDHLVMPDDWSEAYGLLTEQVGFMDTISVTSVPLAPAFDGVTRADLATISVNGRDTSGNPCVWLNEYCCDACEIPWDDRWSCQCDDKCPACGRSVSPHTSTFVAGVPAALEALWAALPDAE